MSKNSLGIPHKKFTNVTDLFEREFDEVKRAEIKDNWAIPIRKRIGIAPSFHTKRFSMIERNKN